MNLGSHFTKKQLWFLSVSTLVLVLTIAPLSIHSLPLSDISFSTNYLSAASANAQTPPESGQPSPPKPESGGDQAAGSEEEGKIEPLKMVMGVLAGLVLFLYGVTRMAEGLEAIAGDRTKKWVSRFTKNRFAGVLTGAAATTILDSSSVTIIMVIAMVGSGLMSFANSLSVVLGSNIGTTIGAQIVAFEINQYAPIALLVGAGLNFFGKSDRQKQIGLIVFGVGLLFFGLDVIDEAMKPFRSYEPFLNLMEQLAKNPIQGAAIGALFTVLVQSSSATVAIVVTLASQGLIGLPAGIALMLGAEVGTCADTLVASIGRGRPALRTGLFHLLFNVTSAAIGIFFATQLAKLAESVSFGADVGRQIANAQLIFNVVGVLIVIWFIPLIARALQTLIPDSRDAEQPAEAQESLINK